MKTKLIVAMVILCSAWTASAEVCVRFHSRPGVSEIKGRGGVFPWSVGLEQIGCDVLGRWKLSQGNEVLELDSYDMACRQVQIRVRQKPSVSATALVTADAFGILVLNSARNQYSGILRGPSGDDVSMGLVRTQGANSEYYMWYDLPPSQGCRNIVIESLQRLEE